MKIAVTSQNNSIDSDFDSRFGRAPWFIVLNTEDGSWSAVDNSENLNAAHGAGTQSARTIINLGVNALVTGHCGPKASEVLKMAGVDIFDTNATSCMDALNKYRSR
ncbi:MAG: NifB/NifX family molybdenum-iron cluster-binding protein [Deltaproteobacteria bacterium]|nr:NifB/NifX family molybdenum-iron cluster-binding protein [Deltaproteobacteria bacterium]